MNKRTKMALMSILLLLVAWLIERYIDDDTTGDEPGAGAEAEPGPPRGNTTVGTFRRAKRLLDDVYEANPRTFYCGCKYDPHERVPDHASCGYKDRGNAQRAARIEVEHVVPASLLGQHLPVWKEGDPKCVSSKGKLYVGRRCAEKVSKTFRLMEADLYNLQPAVGEVNGDRRNYPPGEISGEAREYGRCDVEIEDGLIEPPPTVRGDFARTWLYMDWAYPESKLITPALRSLLEGWSREDPVDAAERARACRIEAIQGNHNPFILGDSSCDDTTK